MLAQAPQTMLERSLDSVKFGTVVPGIMQALQESLTAKLEKLEKLTTTLSWPCGHSSKETPTIGSPLG